MLVPPPGRELVVSADAAIEGVHFRAGDPPDLIARKVLRTNLSDLAAMGADPLGYLLTLAIPPTRDDAFFAAFAAGLAHDQRQFGLTLLGGDTTAGSAQLVVSITILGHLAPGTALRRNGARAGDALWVSGTIGDAALGLRDGAHPHLARRYLLPEPRLGLHLAGIAHAAMDVSDGLVQDAGHLARESGLAVEIAAASVPLSAPARAADALAECLTGGDDYELLLAVPPEHDAALRDEAARTAIPFTRIGRFLPGVGVRVRDARGDEMIFERKGWSHVR